VNVVENVVTIKPSKDKQPAIGKKRHVVSARRGRFAFNGPWFVLEVHKVKQNNIFFVCPTIVSADKEEIASNLRSGMRKSSVRDLEIDLGP